MIRKSTGAKAPKRQIEELAVRVAQDFDAFYRFRRADAADGTSGRPILVMSADGKGVAMRPDDLREQTWKAAEAAMQKMGTRLSKGEKKISL